MTGARGTAAGGRGEGSTAVKIARTWVGRLALALVATALGTPARAIPAFARRYETSCLTCHTVYPKLNAFGEAFRRDGYRFPGIDSDEVKQATVALGQEANKKTFPLTVWPASIPGSVPLSIGVNGQAWLVPSHRSSAAAGDPGGTGLSLHDLVSEGHLWAGAGLDDSTAVFAELSVTQDGAELEHAQLLLDDLVGPRHAVNLVVGKGPSTLTPFGAHSSYLVDQALPDAAVGSLLGNGSAWLLAAHVSGVEVNGILRGRFGYALGVNAGANDFRAPAENVYAYVGGKLGGLRLDGEGAAGVQDPLRPWAETALTLYGFGHRSRTFLRDNVAPLPRDDTTLTWGLGARGQHGSTELDAGWYQERHDHGTDAGTPATARVLFGELSHVLYPWMVPAIRVENVALDTDQPSVDAWHVMPGIAFLLRANVKVTVAANWEHAHGFPSSSADPGEPFPTGWVGAGSGDPGGFSILPLRGAGPTSSSSELETIAVVLAWAL
jgi:hypothetical protein